MSQTMKALLKVGPWLAFVLTWIVAYKLGLRDIVATALALAVWVLAKVFAGCFTTPEDELIAAIKSGNKERIEAARELVKARESGDKERTKAAIDSLAKTIRKGP